MKLVLFVLTFALGTSAYAVNPLDGLPASVAKRHQAIMADECQDDLPSGSESYDLGHGHKLHLVPCVMGAYQGSSRAYLSKNDQYIETVLTLAYNGAVSAVVGNLDLGEATFDPKAMTLRTFSKGRGLGDCGQSTLSKVIADEYMVTVKTIEIRHKEKCDGKYGTWPVVFKQK